MIDKNFIIRYTNSLYTTPIECCPEYKEFRDMFSSGQLNSKEWVITELKKLNIDRESIVIVGSWFATLAFMIKSEFQNTRLMCVDIDPRCEKFVSNLIDYNDRYMISAITEDMFKYRYKEDIIINTSCEHIHDVKKWISLIPKGKIIILQSNDFYESKDHVSCVDSLNDFIIQTDLPEIMFSGELKTPIYTRFMIIGKT